MKKVWINPAFKDVVNPSTKPEVKKEEKPVIIKEQAVHRSDKKKDNKEKTKDEKKIDNTLIQLTEPVINKLNEKGINIEKLSDLLNIRHLNFPIPDLSVPSSENQTIEILDSIKKYIETGAIIYLHCWGGVGRTGVIAGCWLAEHGYPGKAAISRLRVLWKECPKSNGRKTPETDAQEEYIINWMKHRQ